MHRTGFVEQHCTVRSAIGQDQRDIGRSLAERSEALTGGDDVGVDDDRVVARVPLDQLLDGLRRAALRVDDQDDWLGRRVHWSKSWIASRTTSGRSSWMLWLVLLTEISC